MQELVGGVTPGAFDGLLTNGNFFLKAVAAYGLLS
jgi:hypothetical protein